MLLGLIVSGGAQYLNIQYTIYNIQYTIYIIQYTIYIYTLYNIQYTYSSVVYKIWDIKGLNNVDIYISWRDRNK